jgi:hypothetical protein
MSSTSTEFEFTSSLEKDSNVYLTKDRQFMYFNDLQGGNYSNNSSEVRFELVSLANSNQFVNWAESFLLIPLQLSVSGLTAANTAGGLSALPENAFALSLKNGYQHIIDSLLITVNDNPVNQPCQGCNIVNTFKMYSMSADDRKTLGSMLQFYVDTGDSIRYFPNPAVYYTGTIDITGISAPGVVTFTAIATPLKAGQKFVYLGTTYTLQADTTAASTTVQVYPAPNAAIAVAVAGVQITTPLNLSSNGIGECNNCISKATGFNPRDGYQAINGVINQGRLQRMQDTSYDPTTAGNPVSTYFQSATAAGQLFKNHVVTNSASTIVYNIFATIPMATLHDFFDKLPIARGLNVRLNLYLNTGIQINETVTQANHTTINSSVIPRQTTPFMVSPLSNDLTTGSGFSVTTAVTLNYLFKIGNSTLSNARFYASMYNFTPSTESMYISSPERQILYNDVVQYVLPGIGPTANVNNLITSGISRLRGFLMVPIISAGSNLCTLDGKQSPFSSCPGTTFPFAKIQNFQLQISGKPVFSQPVNHTQLLYNTMLRPELSINGGSLRSLGMSSGCIGKTDFESGFSFYWVDLSNLENEADDNSSKSVQVLFTNAVPGTINIDFYIYLMFQKELHLNISNGSFLSL